jgi:hypothetical protein
MNEPLVERHSIILSAVEEFKPASLLKMYNKNEQFSSFINSQKSYCLSQPHTLHNKKSYRLSQPYTLHNKKFTSGFKPHPT